MAAKSAPGVTARLSMTAPVTGAVPSPESTPPVMAAISDTQ